MDRVAFELPLEFIGTAGDDDFAVIDDRDLVRQAIGFFQIVRCQENRQSFVAR